MVRSLLLTCTMLLFVASSILAQTTFTGIVSDDVEPLIGASVKILNGTAMVRGVVTNVDGAFRVQLDPGKYNVEVSYTGYQTKKIEGVQVLSGQLNNLDIKLSASSGTILQTIEIKYERPLIEKDKTSGGSILTSDQIKNLPTRSVNAIVANTAGTSTIDGGAVSIKGSRSNATNYYVDGVRVYGGQVPPVQDIEQLQVITGGLGAEYGDVTGGVISVQTKGPASKLNGSVEVENSRGLDPYGWLLATANVSGPILKKKSSDGKTERTLIGFRLSGQYNTQRDDDPPAFDVPVGKGKFLGADKPFGQQFEAGSPMDLLQTSPLVRKNGIIINRAETFTNDSVSFQAYRPNEGRRDIDLTGKLDFRLTDQINLSVTGTYKDIQNQFTPGGYGDNHWMVFNSFNNPKQYDNRWRTIARFRHRLGNSDKESENKSNFAISNASYQLQVGFERANSRVYDPRHKDNYFDYGYVGKFEYGVDTVIVRQGQQLVHVGYGNPFLGYTAGGINPGLEAYNQYANSENDNSYLAQNGRFSDIYNDVWSGMHTNISQVYNRNSKSQDDYITVGASANFDLKLGKTGIHNIQFGLLNEQRTNREWVLSPSTLWDLARQLANRQYNGLDTTLVVGTVNVDGINVDANGYKISPQGDSKFFYELRRSLGLDNQVYVNPLALTPDQLRLDMFSASELTDLNQGRVTYRGYDYLGNALTENFTFNDFFTHRDANGVRDFPVAAFRPLYQAAYIKDKFQFNKMIFSLGLRVERFDLNTRVMRDKYSLYDIMDARTFHDEKFTSFTRPANIGDNFKVYTKNGYNDNTPVAYRDGDVWYNAEGIQFNDATQIFQGGPINPILADTVRGANIRRQEFDPNTSFEDYTPQINWLPRLAFSFPINEDANFFAHYDVLVQRPPSNWEVTPLNYYYFYEAGRTTSNNANLRPERVVDYEVGFQQKLNQNSALKFSAYYRELRDMIQERIINFVPVIGRYTASGNIDFGTVKGFTLQYDLRRIRNLEMMVAYTLQFADGTGSNAASQRGLRTQLRSLYPLDFDERHSINGIIDYRWSDGKLYDGPTFFGKDIFANIGINAQFNAVSGRPYTSKLRSTRFGGDGTVGSINGNRLPWRFNLDMRIDKTFTLNPSGKKPLVMNVYFRVANVLDRRNVVNVYSVTGSPTDDGYLATAEGQSIQQGVINQGRSIEAYRSSYAWALLNPNNFTLPRRLYVGAAFSF